MGQKKSHNLLGQNNHAKSGAKKNHGTSRGKVTQPLGTKNITTFWDKKSRNLLGQKNHVISWDKNITQPLRTKKNHATSQDKKKHNLSKNLVRTFCVCHSLPWCSSFCIYLAL